MADEEHSARLSLAVAEFASGIAGQLERKEIETEGLVGEIIHHLRSAEVVARRWHMIEAIRSGLIEMPPLEDFDDADADAFDSEHP